jgi:uncharacterized cupin superfamily protein
MKISDVPTVRGDADDPTWYPLQHYFGLTAFGANVFVARDEGQTLVNEHDEAKSLQQELYVVLDGDATFELDGERVDAPRGTAVAVTEPSVRRSAVARSAGTALLVVGVRPGTFETTWHETHFADVPGG